MAEQVNVRVAPEHRELIHAVAARLRSDPSFAVDLQNFLRSGDRLPQRARRAFAREIATEVIREIIRIEREGDTLETLPGRRGRQLDLGDE